MKLFENCSSQRVFSAADFDNLRWQLQNISKVSESDDGRSTINITLTTTTDKLVPISAYDVLTSKVLAKMHKSQTTNYTSAYSYAAYNSNRRFNIKKVIFNDPATIVLWADGTKTVVKSQENDIYDPEKGMAMAIAKRALGDEGSYYNEFKKWVPCEEENDTYTLQIGGELYNRIVTHFLNNVQETINNLESDAE